MRNNRSKIDKILNGKTQNLPKCQYTLAKQKIEHEIINTKTNLNLTTPNAIKASE